MCYPQITQINVKGRYILSADYADFRRLKKAVRNNLRNIFVRRMILNETSIAAYFIRVNSCIRGKIIIEQFFFAFIVFCVVNKICL